MNKELTTMPSESIRHIFSDNHTDFWCLQKQTKICLETLKMIIRFEKGNDFVSG